MKILMLASYFPKPSNMMMGTWALAQATAMNRRLPVTVASLSSWMPWPLGALGLWKTYSQCPRVYDFDGLIVHYPRWLYYPASPFKDFARRDPRFQMHIAWLSCRPSLMTLVDKVKPTHIYAHHICANGYMAMRLHELTGLPYVITEHSYTEIEDCFRHPARKRHYSEIVGKASGIVCVSNGMASSLRQLFQTVNFETVHNGIDIVREAHKEPTGKGNKDLVVFSATFFSERKGLLVLIKAFHRLLKKYPTATLRIAGGGQEMQKILASIQELGLNDRVVVLGTVTHEAVLREMEECDLFALPSWREPFATVFIEAMAASKPIICTSDSGITDVVENGVHGIVVPPKDEVACAEALALLLEDASQRRQMGDNARRLVEDKLTWDKNIESMIRIFCKC